MKIALWSVGKAHESFVKEGIQLYTKRITNYFPAEWTPIPPPKTTTLSEAEQKKQEAAAVRQLLKEGDYLVALDERGQTFTSEAFSLFITQRATGSTKRLVFLIGGAFGIDKGLLDAAQNRWSLSPLTFPHQLVRLILAEQVYRACTILRNEKYHHR